MNESVENTRQGLFDTKAAAEAEKKRMKQMIEKLDEIDDKCDEIRNIRTKLKLLKERVDKAGGRLDNVSIQKITSRLRD